MIFLSLLLSQSSSSLNDTIASAPSCTSANILYGLTFNLKLKLLPVQKSTYSNNMWLTAGLKNLHFPSLLPSAPACFSLKIQLSTSVGKHWGRVGSGNSGILTSLDWIPFWREAFWEVSAKVPDIFSTLIEPAVPLGSSPSLLNWEVFSCLTGDEWLDTTLFVACALPFALEMRFEGVAPGLFLMPAFFAEEDGDDSSVEIFPPARLSFFLCFFSLSLLETTYKKCSTSRGGNYLYKGWGSKWGEHRGHLLSLPSKRGFILWPLLLRSNLDSRALSRNLTPEFVQV